jgi:hypothetical protein
MRCLLTKGGGLLLASMFDRERARGLVNQATASHRAVVATLCLYRVAVVKDDLASALAREAFRDLIDDALGALRARIEDSTAAVDFADFTRRFQEILGPADAPFEEPYGLAAWMFDVVSLADYAIRVCASPSRSDAACFNVLLASYSFAGMLERHIEEAASPPLADLEFTRQMSDLDALLRSPGIASLEFSALCAQSDPLRALMAERFQIVAASYVGRNIS